MAPVEQLRVNMHDRVTPSSQTLSTGLGSFASLQPATFRRAVMYAGLSMGLRASAINDIVAKLESEGFGTLESLGVLSDDLARSLGVPVSLAATLRAQSGGPPSWSKSGPLPTLAELQPNEPSCIPPISHGYATFEATENGMVWNQRLAGFPCKLRDYTPVPSPRLSPRKVVREASCRAEADHKCRMDRARTEREMEFGQLRISAQRREPSPDSWKMSSSLRRSTSVSKLTASGRSMAGLERFQCAKEATGDIALTTPRQSCRDLVPLRNRDMQRQNSSPGYRPWSARQNSLDRSHQRRQDLLRQCSSPVCPPRSPLCKKKHWSPLQAMPQTVVNARSPVRKKEQGPPLQAMPMTVHPPPESAANATEAEMSPATTTVEAVPQRSHNQPKLAVTNIFKVASKIEALGRSTPSDVSTCGDASLLDSRDGSLSVTVMSPRASPRRAMAASPVSGAVVSPWFASKPPPNAWPLMSHAEVFPGQAGTPHVRSHPALPPALSRA